MTIFFCSGVRAIQDGLWNNDQTAPTSIIGDFTPLMCLGRLFTPPPPQSRHWTEKKGTEWSKTQFEELLQHLFVENDAGNAVTTEVSSIEGDAFVNNRKGKLIFIYDFALKVKWKGEVTEDSPPKKVRPTCPNLQHAS